MRKKTKPKDDDKKSILPDDTSVFTHKLTLLSKILAWMNGHKKYLVIGLIAVVLSFIIYLLLQPTQLWAIQSFIGQSKTYPNASVLGFSVGNLDSEQLNARVAQIKSDFEARKLELTNGSDKWDFKYSELGATFDDKNTLQTIQNLNKLNVIDKSRLIFGGISSAVLPAVLVDNEKCVGALSVISIPQTDPKDASAYFDQSIKIKADQPGTKFSAASNCRELSKWLAANLSVSGVYLDTIPANISKAELDSKLNQIQAIAGTTLSLQSGTYRLDLTPDKLLGLLDISKNDSGVQVNWSSRLDELIKSVADQINTYNSAPAISGCQYLISTGGNWLDQAATKKIFQDLGADSPRSYDLTVTYNAPSVGNRSPVARGNNGTVYLTFDDGLTYADQIMNYAACYGIKVTFFELGNRVGIDATALRRAIAEGHAIQSHGFEHALYDYGSRSYDWQVNDMKQSIDAITGVTGVRPTYFRPPGGNRSQLTYDAAAANGLNLILWGVTSSDSAPGGLSSADTCSNVVSRAFSGASVLMHSTHQSTANAVPCIVEGLAARGFNMQALR